MEVIPCRAPMFTANVTNFINGSMVGIGFDIDGIETGPDFIDVDVDIVLTHPFPGMPHYNGYDVRGVFMADGSSSLEYNDDLIYPVSGTDQFMLPDPSDGSGTPDGYTRWFNATEFNGSMPLLSYVPGKYGTTGFAGTATLCPYRYFADGLAVEDDLFSWLGDQADQNGVFSSGATNDRKFYLRFPNGKGVTFGYAVIANWAGVEDDDHPSNAPEAVACDVADSSDVWYISNSQNGGMLNLDISLWDWDSVIEDGTMSDYKIFLESTVLADPYEFATADMTPVAGDENYSTYHVELAADAVSGTEGNEYWIIVEQQGFDYTNDFNVPNNADTDPLTAFFRYDLDVSPSPQNLDPICDLAIHEDTPLPVEDFFPIEVRFDATGSYDPDDDPLTYEWDFDGDGFFDEDPDDNYIGDIDTPIHLFTADPDGDTTLRLTDGHGGESICSIEVNFTGHQSKNIPLRPGYTAVDIGVDPTNADLWIVYDDGQVYKCTKDYWYDDESWAYLSSSWGTVLHMDTASGGFSQFVFTSSPNGGATYIKRPDGSTANGGGWGSAGGPYFWCDAYNYGTTGPEADELTFLVGALNSSGLQYDQYSRGYGPPYTTAKYFVSHSFPLTPITGYNRLFHEYVQGMDSDYTTSSFWALEAPDYYCGAFVRYPISSWYRLTYNNSYFGTGTEEEGDTCWTADVCDLARTPDSRFHVLDNVNDTPVIKVFSGSSSGGQSHGHYGDTTSISSTPEKLDGSDSDSNIVVLHGNSTDGYFISVFKPIEMPE